MISGLGNLQETYTCSSGYFCSFNSKDVGILIVILDEFGGSKFPKRYNILFDFVQEHPYIYYSYE